MARLDANCAFVDDDEEWVFAINPKRCLKVRERGNAGELRRKPRKGGSAGDRINTENKAPKIEETPGSGRQGLIEEASVIREKAASGTDRGVEGLKV